MKRIWVSGLTVSALCFSCVGGMEGVSENHSGVAGVLGSIGEPGAINTQLSGEHEEAVCSDLDGLGDLADLDGLDDLSDLDDLAGLSDLDDLDGLDELEQPVQPKPTEEQKPEQPKPAEEQPQPEPKPTEEQKPEQPKPAEEQKPEQPKPVQPVQPVQPVVDQKLSDIKQVLVNWLNIYPALQGLNGVSVEKLLRRYEENKAFVAFVNMSIDKNHLAKSFEEMGKGNFVGRRWSGKACPQGNFAEVIIAFDVDSKLSTLKFFHRDWTNGRVSGFRVFGSNTLFTPENGGTPVGASERYDVDSGEGNELVKIDSNKAYRYYKVQLWDSKSIDAEDREISFCDLHIDAVAEKSTPVDD